MIYITHTQNKNNPVGKIAEKAVCKTSVTYFDCAERRLTAHF